MSERAVAMAVCSGRGGRGKRKGFKRSIFKFFCAPEVERFSNS